MTQRVLQRHQKEFLKVLRNIKTINKKDEAVRNILNNATYTIQQSVGSALGRFCQPDNQNTARKLNGDLFEHFIRLIIREIGIDCKAGTIQVPVIVDGQPTFNMSYQHDLIIEKESDIKVIGSIKTSSKDRIDKIFIDKFLYNKLTEKATPHIAIFLNDVQRKNNTGLAKVAVQCYADTFVVNQSLVLRINICGENRHLRQARKR
jgi:hypothetical protein